MAIPLRQSHILLEANIFLCSLVRLPQNCVTHQKQQEEIIPWALALQRSSACWGEKKCSSDKEKNKEWI